jgi:hypothetical protein
MQHHALDHVASAYSVALVCRSSKPNSSNLIIWIAAILSIQMRLLTLVSGGKCTTGRARDPRPAEFIALIVTREADRLGMTQFGSFFPSYALHNEMALH